MTVGPRSDRPRALIIGGSLGGLFAANLLRTAGWQVVVFERSPHDLSGRGAGLGATPELFAVLHRLGATVEEELRATVRSRLGLNSDGSQFAELPIRSAATAWDCLYRLLKRMLPAAYYRQNCAFETLRQSENSIAVRFSDGSEAEGDLLVGADGIRSSVRRHVTPSAGPTYAGYVAWRGAVAETDIPTRWRSLLLENMTFSFPSGQLGLTVPMAPGPAGTRRRCQVSWFFRADHGRILQLPLAAGSRIDAPIDHSSHFPREIAAQLRLSAQAHLPPQVSHLVQFCSAPLVQPILDFESSRLANNRVVLLGDAAFIARPHVGTGVTKAALDAVCLADSLARLGEVQGALRSYEQQRLRAGVALVQRGRYLGAFLSQACGAALCAEQKRKVMREFGAAGVVAVPN